MFRPYDNIRFLSDGTNVLFAPLVPIASPLLSIASNRKAGYSDPVFMDGDDFSNDTVRSRLAGRRQGRWKPQATRTGLLLPWA